MEPASPPGPSSLSPRRRCRYWHTCSDSSLRHRREFVHPELCDLTGSGDDESGGDDAEPQASGLSSDYGQRAPPRSGSPASSSGGGGQRAPPPPVSSQPSDDGDDLFARHSPPPGAAAAPAAPAAKKRKAAAAPALKLVVAVCAVADRRLADDAALGGALRAAMGQEQHGFELRVEQLRAPMSLEWRRETRCVPRRAGASQSQGFSQGEGSPGGGAAAAGAPPEDSESLPRVMLFVPFVMLAQLALDGSSLPALVVGARAGRPADARLHVVAVGMPESAAARDVSTSRGASLHRHGSGQQLLEVRPSLTSPPLCAFIPASPPVKRHDSRIRTVGA